MDVRHGEPPRKCNRNYRLSLTPVLDACITSDGLRVRNQDLWERAGQEAIAEQIRRRKWGWIGHTLRKTASSTTRQVLTWNPQGRRRRGRPRNIWRRDIEAELQKQWTSWNRLKREAQNRVRWRHVVDGLCSTGSDGQR